MLEHTLSWQKSLLDKTKLEIYQKYKVLYECEDYCKINLRISQRSLIPKMRLGVFPLTWKLVDIIMFQDWNGTVTCVIFS